MKSQVKQGHSNKEPMESNQSIRQKWTNIIEDNVAWDNDKIKALRIDVESIVEHILCAINQPETDIEERDMYKSWCDTCANHPRRTTNKCSKCWATTVRPTDYQPKE